MIIGDFASRLPLNLILRMSEVLTSISMFDHRLYKTVQHPGEGGQRIMQPSGNHVGQHGAKKCFVTKS
jgi:hypothetical protein